MDDMCVESTDISTRDGALCTVLFVMGNRQITGHACERIIDTLRSTGCAAVGVGFQCADASTGHLRFMSLFGPDF